MFTAAIGTILFLPLYLWIRRPFERLPLHIDTGFYVSNHTIDGGQLDFAKGWNARYAGCCKVLPEFFYSFIYLQHGPHQYQQLSRRYASVFNFVTAIAVGVLACAILGFSAQNYLAAFLAYALLSSEPHWGGYHECGEFFHVLTDALAVTLLIVGLARESHAMVAAASLVFVAGACFIKLSALIPFALLFGAAALWKPVFTPAIAAGLVAALGLFALWITRNGQSVAPLLGPLCGHERAFAKRTDWYVLVHRLREKALRLAHTLRLQPWLVWLIVVGLVVAPIAHPMVWVFTAGLMAAYLFQAADCRYYLLPFLPVLAVVAAAGALATFNAGPIGILAVGLTVAAWLAWNPLRARRLDDCALHIWSWSGGAGAEAILRNWTLHQTCKTIGNELKGNLLVYGPANQAYALLGRSFPTPIISPDSHLDDMDSGWQGRLSEQLRHQPPSWILDSAHCFDANSARHGLGLDYRMRWECGPIAVYAFRGTTPTIDPNAKTFAAVRVDQLEEERRLAGDERRVLDPQWSDEIGRHTANVDPAATALHNLLEEMQKAGHKKLAIYGAGRFTHRHADLYRNSGLTVSMVLDDHAREPDSLCCEWPVCTPDAADCSAFDAVVVSSDRFGRTMLAKLRRRWGDKVRAYTIPGC